MKHLLFFLALLFLPLSVLATEIVVYPENITAEVTPLRQEYKASDTLFIKVTFTNNSQDEISFLTWGTPFEGRINYDIFEIRFEGGQPLPYVGRMIKRGEPTAADYKILDAGKSIEAVVNLQDGYDLTEKGAYSIEYSNRSRLYTDSQPARKSSSVVFRVEEDRPARSFKQPPSFNNCNSSRQTTLNSALTQAENLSRTAKNDLSNTPKSFRSDAERYDEWFGVYNSTRWNTVQSNFNSIYSAINSQTITFDCVCVENYYAYVYPDYPYAIFICNAFWGAPLTGTDSQAGTIIHEISHFTVVAGTDDHVYGQTGARNLAISNPAQAVTNADNHEYFAENTPSLSMPSAIALSEALDNSDFTWQAGGSDPFFGQSQTFYYGNDAAQSGDVGNSQYSYFRTTLPKSGNITFYWKVSSQSNSDYLEFRVDGAVREKISGTVGWTQRTYTVAANSTVEWRYTKDSSSSSGSDSGWVDKISFTETTVGKSITPILPILLKE